MTAPNCLKIALSLGESGAKRDAGQNGTAQYSVHNQLARGHEFFKQSLSNPSILICFCSVVHRVVIFRRLKNEFEQC